MMAYLARTDMSDNRQDLSRFNSEGNIFQGLIIVFISSGPFDTNSIKFNSAFLRLWTFLIVASFSDFIQQQKVLRAKHLK